MHVVILGAGYTGYRVAQLLQRAGIAAETTNSKLFSVADPVTHSNLAQLLKPGAHVLHSVPVVRTDAGYRATMPVIGPLLAAAGVARVVYISTTGVYGDAHDVDEATPVAPRNEREQLRVDEERAVQAGPWSSLVLRPAAIYGPDRGIHTSMAAGKYQLLGDGANFISRIHVDDLAALCSAALISDRTGAYPVADLHPCPAREIAEYCSTKFGYPMPESSDLPADDTRRSDRRVNGTAITRLLGVQLQYPNYQAGLVVLPALGNNPPDTHRATP
jgi:nucleoside-diphosphate-sugar epimerase